MPERAKINARVSKKTEKNAKYSKTIKTFADQDVFIRIPLSSPAWRTIRELLTLTL
jgi:hypothetical protein